MEENNLVNEETYKEEKQICRYCGREMNENFEFCIYCGKSQKNTVLPAVENFSQKKKAPVVKPLKKNAFSTFLLVMSVVFFSASLLFLLSGLLSWVGAGVITTGSVFDNMFGSTDVSAYILCMIDVAASFFLTLIFMFAGFIMMFLRKR